MLFRHAMRPAGVVFRPSFISSASKSAPRFLNAALVVVTRLQPTRLSSSDSTLPPTLEPPWQASDLSQWEQKALAKHGPNYLDEIKRTRRRKALFAAQKRKQIATQLESKLGPDWYRMWQAARQRHVDENVTPLLAEFERRRSLLGRDQEDHAAHRALTCEIKAWHISKTKQTRETRPLELMESYIGQKLGDQNEQS